MSIGVPSAWSDLAARAHRVLVETFWDGRRGLFRVAAGWRLRSPHWHYWWQAHALDACVDAALRTGSARARDRVADLVTGILRRNGGRIVNDYYDDMAWMALALLRAQAIGAVTADDLIAELWGEIRGGWDDQHGGVVWRRDSTYANAPSNGPAAILAARLYRHAGAQEDLDWARRIADWLHKNLLDPSTGLVWDGVHHGAGRPPSPEVYTYNQGTVVGADVELYRCTGDERFLRRAERTAEAALAGLADRATGLLPAEGDGDGGLFKGILARYLGDLVVEAGPVSVGVVREALRRNASAVGPAAAVGTVGPDWADPRAGAGSLSTQLSAVLLLESMARIDTPQPEATGRPPPDPPPGRADSRHTPWEGADLAVRFDRVRR